MSRSGFYKWKADQERKNASKEYDDLLNIVREIYEASGGTYGYRRIDKALRKKGIIVNHKIIYDYIRTNRFITTHQVLEITRIKTSQGANVALGRLMKMGLIVKIRKGRQFIYQLTN